jgi:hypothetical protein
LFRVHNTSGRTLFCLARDPEKAWEIAHCAGHVRWSGGQSRWDLIRSDYSRWQDEVKNLNGPWEAYKEALEEAKARRLEGTVHRECGNLFIGNMKVGES